MDTLCIVAKTQLVILKWLYCKYKRKMSVLLLLRISRNMATVKRKYLENSKPRNRPFRLFVNPTPSAGFMNFFFDNAYISAGFINFFFDNAYTSSMLSSTNQQNPPNWITTSFLSRIFNKYCVFPELWYIFGMADYILLNNWNK